ncbi:peptide chain release factor 1 [Heterostelium album PN500]|uniref:Peptide chain release factor 1 n=1 Tax=Heterostelium pallidum (strain ATCC 26659 / Pp 5 / PN500) TaxID=670386 RepID=D3B5G2_HETP5|nr:peptide chain release factor 1 [Heterostelium album PN500]EFA83110.1 peptide chain release factor 1 [Heterostelium album PN500]|eukprot:XP_020435227.1 peptide chain release factor 1 [Heterostelium album PN500]
MISSTSRLLLKNRSVIYKSCLKSNNGNNYYINQINNINNNVEILKSKRFNQNGSADNQCRNSLLSTTFLINNRTNQLNSYRYSTTNNNDDYSFSSPYFSTTLSTALQNKLKMMSNKYTTLKSLMESQTLSQEDIKRTSNDAQQIEESVQLFRQYVNEIGNIKELKMMLDMEKEEASREMIIEDLKAMGEQLAALEKSLIYSLLPADKDDDGNAIIEIRAGTGGGEAQLFAHEMFRMYEGYAATKGWRFESLDISYTDVGGCREASAAISGKGVFGFLKNESGVHRVQRIPDTETQGRIHTSTTTVAIMPEPKEVDIKINDRDLKIDVFRSSGNGGQSVNTTDSAVRIVHLPTGITVSMQDERSQLQNKSKAMKVLRARLYEMERVRLQTERSAERNSQIGGATRSERIRTYNFPQDRVTDHRVNITTNDIDAIMTGETLGDFIEDIMLQFQTKDLNNLMDIKE